MPTEKIQLPDFLIAELYKESLVDLNTFSKKERIPKAEEEVKINAETIPAAGKIDFLGENGKKVTILVEQPEAAFLHEEDLTFLINILKACQLTLADIAIINIAKQAITYEVIKEQLLPLSLLLFDVEPSSIKLPFLTPAFQLHKFDGCTIMVAPPLTQINKPNQEGKLLKTKLWLSLKQIFKIP